MKRREMLKLSAAVAVVPVLPEATVVHTSLGLGGEGSFDPDFTKHMMHVFGDAFPDALEEFKGRT